MSRPVALVALTRGDATRARHLAARLPEAELHLPTRLAGPGEHGFARATERLRHLFREGRAIVGFCAAGILVRALAPVLGDKRREPPVLAVSADCRHLVVLLGAHRGGEALARRLAPLLEAVPVTTARGSAALDDPPAGFVAVLPPDAATFLRAVAEGEPLRLEDPGDLLPAAVRAALAVDPAAPRTLAVDWRALAPAGGRLVWHPRVLAVGVGTVRGAPPEAVTALVERTLAEAGLAPAAVACVVSIDRRMDEPAIHAVAGRLGVPARFFTAEELAAEASRVSDPSAVVARAVGTPSVAEAAALRAVGPDGTLVVPKRREAVATCAVARAPSPLDPARIGRPRGVVRLVGIGPGDPARLTREAEAALAAAEHLVGYRRYLELLGPRTAGKRLHPFALGEELDRCRHALTLAAAGGDVALVCSGDAGIYAMASPLLELLAVAEDPAWRRVDLRIVPGITAMQAAAAASGAPLGHDFCVLSLSDLLTPRSVIRARAEAAARAGFVLALYNPAARGRRGPLREVLAVLARHRPPETPVVVARRLGREGEETLVTTLAELDPETVDMETVLLVGNPASRRLVLGGRTLVVTPRGYRP